MTTETKIDVHASTLFMEFDDIVIRFNILNAMKHPSKDHFVFCDGIIDDVVDEYVFYFHPFHAIKYPFFLNCTLIYALKLLIVKMEMTKLLQDEIIYPMSKS